MFLLHALIVARNTAERHGGAFDSIGVVCDTTVTAGPEGANIRLS